MINISDKFSLLMAVYKKDDSVAFREALDSVYSNTIQPKKLILVADGSLTPELDKVVNDFKNRPNFCFKQLEKNVGLANALNFGLKFVDTNYVIRADSDDVNLPNRFEVILSLLEMGYDLVGSSILEIEKDGTPVAVRKTPCNHTDIVKFARKRNPFNHMSVGYRFAKVIECGGYPDIYLKEDYGLWALMLKQGAKTMNTDQVLVHAKAGIQMFQRRGGIKYALAEFKLQRHLVSCELKNPVLGLIDAISRGFVFIAPGFFRAWVYRNFLRKHV